MPSGTIVLRFDPARVDALEAVLSRSDFRFESRPHAFFLAHRPGVTVTAYTSGKLLLTGAQAEEYAGYLQHGRHDAPVTASQDTRDASGTRPGPDKAPAGVHPRAGSDEAGKGDYFGPLVVAAVLIPDAATERLLREKGVRDSKTLSGDAEAELLASLVQSRCPHEVVAIPPARYNDLHAKTGNLNKLLAWAHARAIEDLLERHPDTAAVTVDRFARGPRLKQALFERGRAVGVTEIPHAESQDLAVAAASLVARGEFLRALAGMRETWGLRFPKGAGHPVISAGRAFLRRHGRSALKDVAKLHFATTDTVERRGP